MSLEPRIWTDVLSSTQLIGAPFSAGFTSQTSSDYQPMSPVMHHGVVVVVVVSGKEGVMWVVFDVLASTSPPRHMVDLPIPVRTTEQYCALLLTTWFSRFSMYSRDVSGHVLGRVESVSNL